MTLGDIGRIEINNDGTVTIDGIIYTCPENVVIDYPVFANTGLLDCMFDSDINSMFLEGNYERW